MPPRPLWFLLGCAPTMPLYIDRLWARYVLAEPNTIVATTNAGIHECNRLGRSPDWYGVMELATPDIYGRFYEPHRPFTRIFTTDVALRNFAPAGIDFRPDFIAEVAGWCDQVVFRRGTYVAVGATGGHLLQHAVNLGAKKVVLVGFDGYKSRPGHLQPDTFDGKFGPSYGESHTKQWYGPGIQQVINACPDVVFEFYGRPTFPIVGKNVAVCRSPEEMEQWLRRAA